MNKFGFLTAILTLFILTDLFAQEVITPLLGNPTAEKYYEKKISSRKSASADTMDLPIIDDFSNYHIEPNPDIWSDRHAFINHVYSVNPITIGVATLDAINYDGSLYPHATIDPNTFVADNLTSHPINLDYPASDSIYLSFFYQPEGLGEIPEPNDSLTLQFYQTDNDLWSTIWQIPGDSLRNFQLVMIPVTDSVYLKKGFKFRFRNLASLSKSNDFPDKRGNVDHWNIDYVKLDRFRSLDDTIHRDVAFIQHVPSILKELESLPWKHFEPAYNTILNTDLSIRYLNNDSITRNITRSLVIDDLLFDESPVSGQPTAQDLPPFEDTVVNFSYIYPFDFDQGDSGLFKVTASLRTDEFDNKNNDTVSRVQVFKDYYAYDDGTAEFGYGIRGQGSKDGKVAVKYNIYKSDVLAGVEAYFTHLYDSINLNYYFRFVVWNDNEGIPGSIIYEDDRSHRPVYSDSINSMIRFEFDEPVPVEGVVWVGWTQVNEYLLNIGLDINKKPSGPALFYNIGSGWVPSNAPGIIMLRPYMQSVPNSKKTWYSRELSLYPNPAGNILHLDLPDEVLTRSLVELFDLRGRLVLKKDINGNTLDISALDEGLYIIRLRSGSELFNSKLLIQR